MTHADWMRRPLALAAAFVFLAGIAGCEERTAEQTSVPPGADRQVVEDQPGPGVQTEQVDGNVRSFIYYPTGEQDTSYLLIEKIGPAQVNLGQEYQYTIQVTNLSKTPLSGVAVREDLPHGLGIQQAQPMAQMQPAEGQQGQPMMMSAQAPQQQQQMQQQQQQQQPGPQQQVQPQQGQQPAQQPAPQAQPQQGQQPPAQQQQQPQPQQPQQQMQAVWHLGELQPGETQRIQVTAIADTPGDQPTCIQVAFQPTLCAVTRVINPQLALAKQGPELADICEPIVYRYSVHNTGTGTAQNVRIEDPLPEGFVTEDGNDTLQINVGELPAGERRDYEVTLFASQPGQFGSRATAVSANDRSTSPNVTTQVVAPNLEVSIDAPEWELVNQRVDYRVTVTNQGQALARGTTLQVQTPQNGRPLIRPDLQGEQREAATRGEYQIGDLRPGESRTVRLAYSGQEQGPLQLAAVARAVCARAPEETVVARDTAQTFIAAVPALQIQMIDSVDPVRVGGTTIYSIVVRNEGSAQDNNIRLRAMLPEGMQFVNAQGPTEVQVQGNQLNFAPLQTLPAGETATWRVEARATQPQQAQFQAQLLSETVTQPITVQEPTTLLQ